MTAQSLSAGRRLDPKVRKRIRSAMRRTKAKIAKHDPALLGLMEHVFLHGPLEQERASPEALKHPEFHDMFDEVSFDGRKFWELSGEGRYRMTGEHAAIDEKPWRPLARADSRQ